MVTKFNRTVPDNVIVMLALYRVASKNIDVVFSINIPHKMAQTDSNQEASIAVWKDTFTSAVESLQIVDYGVFA